MPIPAIAGAPSPLASATVTAKAKPSRPPSPPAPKEPCDIGQTIALDTIADRLEGSFSAAGADEVFGHIHCDPDRDDLGGFALASRAGDELTIRRFLALTDFRISIQECRPLRLAGGRSLVICREGLALWGVLWQSVIALDYERPDGDERVRVFAVPDTVDTACEGFTEVSVASLDKLELKDLNGDGVEDLRITVRAAKVKAPRHPPCQNGRVGSGAVPRPKLPPPQVIELLTSGATFAPSPRSARAVAAINALHALAP